MTAIMTPDYFKTPEYHKLLENNHLMIDETIKGINNYNFTTFEEFLLAFINDQPNQWAIALLGPDLADKYINNAIKTVHMIWQIHIARQAAKQTSLSA